MSLRELAEKDLSGTLEDPAGFGWPVTITDPDGNVAELTGQSNDIGYSIDSNGAVISGREASVAFRISSLIAAGLDIPEGVIETTRKPWRVSFGDINGRAHTFKISETMPDRGLGYVNCKLELYRDN